MARGAVLWLALLAAYAAGAGTAAVPGGRAAPESAHLAAAEALGAGLGAGAAERGLGLPLLILPAREAGGPILAELWLAALCALGFAAAAAIARRAVPEPYATGGALAAALSLPAIGGATAIAPAAAAGAALAGAALLALRQRERPRLPEALWAGVLLAALPWLGPAYAPAGLVVLAAMSHWLLRQGRSLPAVLAAEVVAASVLAYVTVNDGVFGGPLPPAGGLFAATLPGPWESAVVHAPLLALAGLGTAALWRSRRTRIARAVPERREAEAATGLALATVAALVAGAAFADPELGGGWLGPPHLAAGLPLAAVPAAWGLRRAPRTGTALALLSAGAGLAGLIALRAGLSGGWAQGPGPLH